MTISFRCQFWTDQVTGIVFFVEHSLQRAFDLQDVIETWKIIFFRATQIHPKGSKKLSKGFSDENFTWIYVIVSK